MPPMRITSRSPRNGIVNLRPSPRNSSNSSKKKDDSLSPSRRAAASLRRLHARPSSSTLKVVPSKNKNDILRPPPSKPRPNAKNAFNLRNTLRQIVQTVKETAPSDNILVDFVKDVAFGTLCGLLFILLLSFIDLRRIGRLRQQAYASIADPEWRKTIEETGDVRFINLDIYNAIQKEIEREKKKWMAKKEEYQRNVTQIEENKRDLERAEKEYIDLVASRGFTLENWCQGCKVRQGGVYCGSRLNFVMQTYGLPERKVKVNMMLDGVCIRGAAEGEVVPAKAVPEMVAPENVAPEKESPEKEAPEMETPEKVTQEEATPEEAKPEEATPEKEAPEKAAPEKAAPQKVTPEKSPPEPKEEDKKQEEKEEMPHEEDDEHDDEAQEQEDAQQALEQQRKDGEKTTEYPERGQGREADGDDEGDGDDDEDDDAKTLAKLGLTLDNWCARCKVRQGGVRCGSRVSYVLKHYHVPEMKVKVKMMKDGVCVKKSDREIEAEKKKVADEDERELAKIGMSLGDWCQGCKTRPGGVNCGARLKFVMDRYGVAESKVKVNMMKEGLCNKKKK